jgi:hypothetical protein
VATAGDLIRDAGGKTKLNQSQLAAILGALTSKEPLTAIQVRGGKRVPRVLVSFP